MSAYRMALPIAAAQDGDVLCPLRPNAVNDHVFAEWEAPLTWHQIRSLMVVDDRYGGRRSLRFTLGDPDPGEVATVSWHLWYDKAIVTREDVPADCTIRGTFAFENGTTAHGSDNTAILHPWVGIVARMQDLRRYYFCCLEYPDGVTLYRREDDYWLPIARREVGLDIGRAYELRLSMRGSWFEGRLDGRLVWTTNDYQYADGKAGVRTNCGSVVLRYDVEATARAAASHARAVDAHRREAEAAAAELPKAVLAAQIDLARWGASPRVLFGPFASADRPLQCLVHMPEAQDGPTHALVTVDGRILWESRVPGVASMQCTTPRRDGHCDLVAIGDGELLLIDGRAGTVRKRLGLSSLPNPPEKLSRFGSASPAYLNGDSQPGVFFFGGGANDCDVWAVNEELEPSWHQRVPSGIGHGNQRCACDLDGDGREEVFVGAALLAPDGEIIWTQDEVVRRLRRINAGHVDSAVIGFLAGRDEPPTVHMRCGSAGHIVADGRTGEMLAVHPQGHVQGGAAGKVVADEPGIQVVACCRWANYGITGVYSAGGRLLSRFQPDYASDSVFTVNWTGSGCEHLLIAGAPYRIGLYDWRGRRLVDLSAYADPSRAYCLRNQRGQAFGQSILDDPRDNIVIRRDATVFILAPVGCLPPGARVYCPIRRFRTSQPGWVTVE